MNQACNIQKHFIQLDKGEAASILPITDSFWQDLAGGAFPGLDAGGRLVSSFSFSEPWPTWEMHPAGEEVVLLLSGRAELLLETAAGERTRMLLDQPGQFALVPRGVWHTALTAGACSMLFITPGAGTQHREA